MPNEVVSGTQYQPLKIGPGWFRQSKARCIVLAVIVTAGLIAFEHWIFGTGVIGSVLSLVPGLVVALRPEWIDRLFLSDEERAKGWSIRPRRRF